MAFTVRASLAPAVVALAAAPAALAGLSQSSIGTGPGGYAQAVAGPGSFGTVPWGGSDLALAYPSSATVNELAFSGNASASRSASFTNSTISNFASTTFALGWGKLYASNTSPNNASFAQANAGGGWTDRYTITNPAKTGQAGIFVFGIAVDGLLSASGPSGRALLNVTAYVNGNQLDIYGTKGAYHNNGSSTPIATDRQTGWWEVASAPDASLGVNSVVTFAAPFVFGTPFSLGVYAQAQAGQRSTAGSTTPSTALANFGSTLTWAGINSIRQGDGTAITGSTVSADSGTDWTGPIVPAPAGSAVLALAGLAAARRRR